MSISSALFGSDETRKRIVNDIKQQTIINLTNKMINSVSGVTKINTIIDQSNIVGLNNVNIKGDLNVENIGKVRLQIISNIDQETESKLKQIGESQLNNAVREAVEQNRDINDALGITTVASGIASLLRKPNITTVDISNIIANEFRTNIDNVVQTIINSMKQVDTNISQHNKLEVNNSVVGGNVNVRNLSYEDLVVSEAIKQKAVQQLESNTLNQIANTITSTTKQTEKVTGASTLVYVYIAIAVLGILLIIGGLLFGSLKVKIILVVIGAIAIIASLILLYIWWKSNATTSK